MRYLLRIALAIHCWLLDSWSSGCGGYLMTTYRSELEGRHLSFICMAFQPGCCSYHYSHFVHCLPLLLWITTIVEIMSGTIRYLLGVRATLGGSFCGLRLCGTW